MSLRATIAALGISLALLTGCASAPIRHQVNPGCYWPGPTYSDCREIIEFNGWR